LALTVGFGQPSAVIHQDVLDLVWGQTRPVGDEEGDCPDHDGGCLRGTAAFEEATVDRCVRKFRSAQELGSRRLRMTSPCTKSGPRVFCRGSTSREPYRRLCRECCSCLSAPTAITYGSKAGRSIVHCYFVAGCDDHDDALAPATSTAYANGSPVILDAVGARTVEDADSARVVRCCTTQDRGET